MNNPVVWFEIYVSDMERSKKFYQTLIGADLIGMENPVPERTQMKMMGFPFDEKSNGCSGALIQMDGMPLGSSNGVIVYFKSEECEKLAEKMQTLGAHIVKPKTSIGEHGYFCLIKDPDSNIIGLHSMN
ncbi:MAG TPA: VOC family protein [Bacteriovoracaceae bacterium]|nr:VOC family protein [Bacteriovoracaceae bacterium]